MTKQISLATTGFELVTKRACKRVFFDEIDLVVPWAQLVGLIDPFATGGTGANGGHPPFAVETMLRIHFLEQWFALRESAMVEALHDISLYCQFARLDPGGMRLPDEITILRLRHLLEPHDLSIQLMGAINATLDTKGLMLKTGTVVDALVAAPSSAKNNRDERDPEMHQTNKGNRLHFGMKAHIGVDTDLGLVTVIGTAVNVNDATQEHGLLHGEEAVLFADAGYQGAMKGPEAMGVDLHVTMRTGKRRVLDKQTALGALREQAENAQGQRAGRAGGPLFRVIKCQFGFNKVRYKGLAKNTAQLITLFALSNV